MTKKQKGILYIIIAALCFSSSNLFVKLAGALPSGQKGLFSYAVSAIGTTAMMCRGHVSFRWQKGNSGLMLVRALLGVAAVIAGSVLMFLLARRLGREAVRRFLDRGVMDKYLPIIEEKQDMFLFLTLLFPFFPDDMLCILAGLTSMPTGRFAGIMLLARPWGLIFAALLGSGVLSLPPWGWAVLVAVMAVIFVLAMKYSRQIEERLFALASRLSGRRKEQ